MESKPNTHTTFNINVTYINLWKEQNRLPIRLNFKNIKSWCHKIQQILLHSVILKTTQSWNSTECETSKRRQISNTIWWLYFVAILRTSSSVRGIFRSGWSVWLLTYHHGASNKARNTFDWHLWIVFILYVWRIHVAGVRNTIQVWAWFCKVPVYCLMIA